MILIILQNATSINAVGEEGTDPSDSSLIKAACTVSKTLGYKLEKVSRSEGFV